MRYKILVVDDEPVNLRLLDRLFRRSHEVITAGSGSEGIKMLESHNIALILSDQRMPGMTGIEFLKRAAELRPKTVRIVLTGYTDINDLVEAINSGVVYKYITKPWVNEELQQTVTRGLEHYEAFKDRHDLLQQNARLMEQADLTRERFIQLISQSIRSKDVTWPERRDRITEDAVNLGRWLDLDEVEVRNLSYAAKLCEIARFSSPGGPGQKELFDEAHKASSSAYWAALLDGIPEMSDVALAIRFQHESYDGTGLPGEQSGEEIPLLARILSVVTSYDSLRSSTDNVPGSEQTAFETLERGCGTKFDPTIVEAFRVVRSMDSTLTDVTLSLADQPSVETQI